MEKLHETHVETVTELLGALGGAAFVRNRLDLAKSNTTHWRRQNVIPARHYANILRLADERRERDGVKVTFPADLFSFDDMPEVQPTEAAE